MKIEKNELDVRVFDLPLDNTEILKAYCFSRFEEVEDIILHGNDRDRATELYRLIESLRLDQSCGFGYFNQYTEIFNISNERTAAVLKTINKMLDLTKNIDSVWKKYELVNM